MLMKECWQPAYPPNGYAIVSASLYASFQLCAAFRGLIGEVEVSYSAASDAEKIQALLEFVAWCVSEGNQADTILRENSRPCYNSIAPNYKRVCRCLRRLLNAHCKGLHSRTSPSMPLDFVGHTVGKTGPGFVVGLERPNSLDVSRVGLFILLQGQTKSSPRGTEWYTCCIF